jgi:hypothetical protein
VLLLQSSGEQAAGQEFSGYVEPKESLFSETLHRVYNFLHISGYTKAESIPSGAQYVTLQKPVLTSTFRVLKEELSTEYSTFRKLCYL